MSTATYKISFPDGRAYRVTVPNDFGEQRWKVLVQGLRGAAGSAAPSPAASTAEQPDQPPAPSAEPDVREAAPPSSASIVTTTAAAPQAPRLVEDRRPTAPPLGASGRWGGSPGLESEPPAGLGDEARGLAGAAQRGFRAMQQIPPAFQAAMEVANRETAQRQGLPIQHPFQLPGVPEQPAAPSVSSVAPWLAHPFQAKLTPQPPAAAPEVSPAVRRLAELEAAKRGTFRSAAQRELASAPTTGAKFKAWIQDPVELTSSIMLESLPASLAGGLLTGAAGPVGLGLGMGLSSFAATTAGELVGAGEQLGFDMSDPAQADAFFRSAQFAEAASSAMQKAAVVGGIDAATARVAGRWLGPAMSQGLRQRVIATGKEMGLQMAGGGGGEALGSVAAGQTPDLFDVFSEVVAEVAPVEAAVNVAGQRRQPSPTSAQPPRQAVTQPGGAPITPEGQATTQPEREAITPEARGMIQVHPIPTTTAEVRHMIETASTLDGLQAIAADPGVRQLANTLSPVEQQGLTVLLQDRAAALEAAVARAETERKALALTGTPSVSGQGQGPIAATKEEAAAAVAPTRELLPPQGASGAATPPGSEAAPEAAGPTAAGPTPSKLPELMTPEEHGWYIVEREGFTREDVVGISADGMPILPPSEKSRTVSGTRNTLGRAFAAKRPVNRALFDAYNASADRPLALPEGYGAKGDVYVHTGEAKAAPEAPAPPEEEFEPLPEVDVAEDRRREADLVAQLDAKRREVVEREQAVKELEPKVRITKGPRYRRGQQKANVKKADRQALEAAETAYRKAWDEGQAISRQLNEVRERVSVAGDVRAANDPQTPVLRRLVARRNVLQATRGQIPRELSQRILKAAQADVRRRVPDADPEELKRASGILIGAASTGQDLGREWELNPQLDLHGYRRQQLRTRVNQLRASGYGAIPPAEFPPDLRADLDRAIPGWYEPGAPSSAGPPLSRADYDRLSQRTEAFATGYQQGQAQREKAKAKAAAESEARAQKEAEEARAMLTETARQMKAEGTPRDAAEVKEELITRLEAAIKKAPAVLGEEKAPTQVTIAVPGDGVFVLRNTVENLRNVLQRAQRLQVSSQAPDPSLGKVRGTSAPKLAAKRPAAAEILKELKGFTAPDREGLEAVHSDGKRALAVTGSSIVEVTGALPGKAVKDWPSERIDSMWPLESERQTPTQSVPTEELWRIGRMVQRLDWGQGVPFVDLWVNPDGSLYGEATPEYQTGETESGSYGIRDDQARYVGRVRAEQLTDLAAFGRKMGEARLDLAAFAPRQDAEGNPTRPPIATFQGSGWRALLTRFNPEWQPPGQAQAPGAAAQAPSAQASLAPARAPQQPAPEAPARPDQARINALRQLAAEEGLQPEDVEVIWAPNWIHTDQDGRQFWIQGAPQGRRVILNAGVPTMADRANARKVIREEIAHIRLASAQGRQLVLDFVRRHLSDGIRQQLARQGYTRDRYASPEAYEQAIAEEFIAKQARENTTLWRRLVDLVRRWLAERGLANLTPEEAARGILASVRRSQPAAAKRPTVGGASLAEQPSEEVAKKFREDLLRVQLDDLKAPQTLQLGRTSPALQAAGLPDGPMYIKQETVRGKPKDPRHIYPMRKLMRLPEALEDPVLVHESWTEPGTYVAILDLSHQGESMAAALHFRTTADGVEVTEVASVYPRRTSAIYEAISRTGLPGGVTYYHEQKVRDWLAQQSGYNSPQYWVQILGRANLPTNRKPRQGPPGLSLAPITSRSQTLATATGAAPRATAQPSRPGRAAPAAATGALPPLPVMDRETGRYLFPPVTEQHRLAEELDSLNLWSLTPKPGPIGTAPGPHASDPNRSVFPIHLPEAVEFMAAILGGKFPRLRDKLRALKGSAAGVARFRGPEAEIELRRDLWALDTETVERLRQEAAAYARDTAQREGLGAAMQGRIERDRLDYLIKEEVRNNPPATALKVLWHEIGHVADWLSEKTLARGNILGRIASLKKYLEHTLPMGPGIPHRPVTPAEKADLRKQAQRELEAEMGTWREIIERIRVEEPIYETLGITPDTIKAMFGMEAREQHPELYRWFASQPDEVKVQIVKAAMKGIVDPRAAAQGGQTRVGTRVVEREFRRTVPGRQPTQAEIIERFRRLLREEMDRRQQVDLATIKGELEGLIAWWHGAERMPDYFKTAIEMYAEAFSVFMNNPAAVAARAPYYYRLFQNYLERKPEVATIYNEIQDRIRAGTVMANRVMRLREAWRKADEESLAYREETKAAAGKARDSLDSVSYHLVRRFGPIFRRARRSGTPAHVREAIGDFVYRASEHEHFLRRVNHEVGVPLVAANLDWNDLGEYMFHKNITEHRFVHDPVTGILRPIANPEGWTADTSNVRLQEMERELGPDRWAALVRAQEQFRAIYETMVVGPMQQEGMVSPELMRAISERVFYATFAAVQAQREHTIEKLLDASYGTGVGAAIYRQTGQLGHVKQPATSTVLKALSLMTAIRRNRLAREIVALMQEVEPEMIQEAKVRWVNERMEPVIEETDHVGTITYLENGKLHAYYVPKLIAKTLKEGSPVSLWPIPWLMRATRNLKGWLTQLNAAFWPVAAARDLVGWGMQLPGVTAPAQYFRYMPGALRAAYSYYRGRPNAMADLAMSRRLKISRMDATDYAEISNEYDRQLAGYGIEPAQWSKEVGRLSALRRFWEAYKGLGQISEFAHKIAGMNYLDANFPDLPEWKKAEIVRERAGSPDFLQKPAASGYMDLVFLFVNPWKEGLISLAKAAKENPWSFTAKTTAMVLAPTVLQAMAAGGWLGDDLDDMYKSVSDYDLLNYLVVPLWWHDRAQRKVGYLRLPLWEPARIVHAAMQRTLTGRGGGVEGLSAQLAGSVPGFNPVLDTALAWIQYEAFGVNPTDGYTGRPWLDQTTFQAGGWPARLELLKRSWNELGGSVIWRLRQARPDDVNRTQMEKVLETSGVQQLLGRWIKISNQGIFDADRAFGQEVAQRRADLRLASRQIIEKLVLHEPLSPSERQVMREPYAMQYIRRQLPEAVRNRSGILQQRLARAQTTEEKRRILKAEAALRSAPGPAPVNGGRRP